MRYFINNTLVLLFCFILSFTQILQAEEQKILKITGWDVYGDPDNPEKTIGYKSFESKTGAKILFTPLSNLDDIVSVAESADEYDIFIISNEGIRILHDMGLVNPLNLTDLPHYQNLHPNLKYSEWSQFNSKIYAVPWRGAHRPYV